MEVNEKWFLGELSRITESIIREYTPRGQLLRQTTLRRELDDTPLLSEAVLSALLRVYSRVPRIVSINSSIFYTSVQAAGTIFLVGPLRIRQPLRFNRDLSVPLGDTLWSDLLSSVSILDWNTCFEAILSISNLLSGENDPAPETPVTIQDLLRSNCFWGRFETNFRVRLEDQVFSSLENEVRHNPYDQEIRELTAIEQGDPEAFERSISEVYAGKLGVLSDDPLRNWQDMAIVVVSNSIRAAIRGGVPAERAFSMNDLFIREIESMHSSEIVKNTIRDMQRQILRVVCEYRDAAGGRVHPVPQAEHIENEHVTACKNYIYTHLHGKLSLSEIAEALSITPEHLSRTFKKSEGITLTEYILRAKITLVKNLLKYSAYTYSEIASYLGFSSQSHMGKQFLRQTGMTPGRYRAKYQVQEFIG